MKTFLTILKNDYFRTRPRLFSTVVQTLVLFGSVFLAVYVTGLQQIRGHVAYVTIAGTIPPSSPFLDITAVSEKPPLSALYQQKFDAVVFPDTVGGLHIETLRNAEFGRMLLTLLTAGTSAGNEEAVPDTRKAGVAITGFMMLFLLLQVFANLFVFADDREQGQLARIAVSPAGFGWYLAAHCVYSLSLLIPGWVLLTILYLSGWNTGFNSAEFAGIMTATGLFGISVAMLFYTLIKKPDNAQMLGNAVFMLTTILSGSFYAAPVKNSLLAGITRIIPQHAIMDFARALASGTAVSSIGYILYVTGCTLVLLIVSCTILYRRYATLLYCYLN